MDIDKIDDAINIDHYLASDYKAEDIFIQEININLAFDTMHFLMNAAIYLYECIVFSWILSDMICGRSSKLDIVNFLISFVGSSFSYGLLFFTFSSYDSWILIYDIISIFLLYLNFAIEMFQIGKGYYYKWKHKASKAKK